MLAEMGDRTFRLGTVHDSYADIMLSDALLNPLTESITLSAPMCATCAFEPYCGADRYSITRPWETSLGIKRCRRSAGATWASSACCYGRCATTRISGTCYGGGHSETAWRCVLRGGTAGRSGEEGTVVLKLIGRAPGYGLYLVAGNDPGMKPETPRAGSRGPRASEMPGPVLGLGPELAHLDAGDIIYVSVDGRRIGVLWKNSARHNGQLLTEQCDNCCSCARSRRRTATTPGKWPTCSRVPGRAAHAGGLVGHLRQSCRAQHVNHVLPGELHRDHRTLDFVRSRRGHIIQLPGQAPYLESGGS